MKFFWILMLSSLTVFAQDDENEDWTEYSKGNISLQYPSDWELDETGNMGTTVILTSQQDDDDDMFRENVNVIIQDLSAYPGMTLEQYRDVSEKQLKGIFQNYKLLDNTIETVDGKQRLHFLYTGEQEGYTLKFEQYGWIIDGSAYIITFTTEKSMYNIYKETGQRILNSLQIK